MLERVFREAIEGEPESVLRVIDAHGYSGEDFLMNVGDVKGVILDNAVRRRAPKVVVELGGYIGYSAVRIGRLLGDGAHLYSIEANPLFAAIATKIVEHAGLASKVTVVVGASDVVLPTLKQRFGLSTIDLLFIDHVKSLYLRDIRHAEQLGLLRRGSIVVADNVIFPGAPDYLRYIRANPRFVSHMHSSTLEYTPSVVDAVAVSEYQ